MKVLITGGAGFIGSNLIHYWQKKHPKDYIVNLDKLTYAGHLSSLKNIKKSQYKFIKGDITNRKLVDQTMRGIDLVIHLAAESHVDRSIVDPSIFLKTNVMGTHILLDAALKHKVKHFHHVSTDEVFGSLSLNSKNKFDENTLYDPRSPYSASKAASDHLVSSYFHTFGLPITITNCSNNFGPYQDPEKFLPRFVTNLIDNKQIPIYGDGKYVRDWLYVQDHCQAIDLVINKGETGETYVVGGLTKDINNFEVAKYLLKIFGKNESSIKYVKDRSGHDRKYAVNWSKIKKIGYKPENNFEKSLAKTVKWYEENEWWWRPLKARSEKLYAKTGQR